MELLIDGVRYELWTPDLEKDLEKHVKEHSKDIFGEDSIYFDIKQKIKSPAGIGSIPDGYVITLGDTPCWYIVEVELSSHPLYDHIVPQMTKFINGIGNASSQREIVNTIDERVKEDEILKAWIKQRIGIIEIHKFLSSLISNAPILAIIIEKETEQLQEVSKLLSGLEVPTTPPTKIEAKVVEFITFQREGVGLAVHAHLFEPLWKPVLVKEPPVVTAYKEEKLSRKKGRVTIQDLLDAGLVQVKQKIFRDYKGKRYEAEILPSSKIKYLYDDTEWNTLSGASDYITKTSTDGWTWWHTIANGEECLLDNLRSKL